MTEQLLGLMPDIRVGICEIASRGFSLSGREGVNRGPGNEDTAGY